MDKEALSFLKSLVSVIGPSGFEEDAVSLWKKRTEKFSQNIKIDVNGNCIASLNEGADIRIMLAGHIDEIGFMIKYIDKDGFLYFSPIGGIDLHLISGQRVKIKTKSGEILGVIGKKPVHLMEDKEKKEVGNIENFWIDIGAGSEKEALSKISIGDVAVIAVDFDNLEGDNVVAKSFDDKCGAFVVSEVIKNLADEKFSASVYGVATVQEEIGLRGAKTSAYGVSPDIGVAVDVTFATDHPDMDKKKSGDIKLGFGPVIARGPNIHPEIFRLLIETAKKENIPYQIEAIPRSTGTDANVIQLTKSGVKTGLISIPLRYMHTPVEVINLKDLENASKLIKGAILQIG